MKLPLLPVTYPGRTSPDLAGDDGDGDGGMMVLIMMVMLVVIEVVVTGGCNPKTECHRVPLFLLKVQQFYKHKHFSDCSLTLVISRVLKG